MTNYLWVIVHYIDKVPFYYMGYFGKYDFSEHETLKPAMSTDFNQALQLTDKQQADRITDRLNRTGILKWKVETHIYNTK